MTDFDDLVKRIDATLDDEVALLMTPAPQLAIEPAEVAVERVVEIARRLEDLPPLTDKIKMTRDEWDWLQAANPPIDRPPSLLDVPVELVDNPEESTLYRPPCCDRHGEQCEVPTECCDACPEAVALRAFVAEWDRKQAVWHSRYWNYPTIVEPEPVEPRADQARGWLARAIERWFG